MYICTNAYIYVHVCMSLYHSISTTMILRVYFKTDQSDLRIQQNQEKYLKTMESSNQKAVFRKTKQNQAEYPGGFFGSARLNS